MPAKLIYRVETIAAYHQLVNLPPPTHPLISVVRFEDSKRGKGEKPQSLINNFYSIALKRNFNGQLNYGQQPYDFQEGVMVFLAPGQVLSVSDDEVHDHTGWLLMIHPDFLWGPPWLNEFEGTSFSTTPFGKPCFCQPRRS